MPILLALLVAAAPPADRVLIHHDYYPGFLPGPFGRTSLTLTLATDGGATLVIETATPPQEQRQRFNPTEWLADAGTLETSQGSVSTRPAEAFTVTFPNVVLDCAPKLQPVHAAGASVTPPASCSPCYERCRETPRWVPSATHPRPGYSCTFGKGTSLPSVGERVFFAGPPGVERVVGATDCPSEGLREPGPPIIDWLLFPEGTTALRDTHENLKVKHGYSARTISVTRTGSTIELRADDLVYRAAGRAGVARTDDGLHGFALSCWADKLTLHSTDLRFDPGKTECEGQAEVPRSRKPRRVASLSCLQLRDGAWEEEVLEFVPNTIIERLDIDADCTMRQAVRELPSLSAPPF